MAADASPEDSQEDGGEERREEENSHAAVDDREPVDLEVMLRQSVLRELGHSVLDAHVALVPRDRVPATHCMLTPGEGAEDTDSNAGAEREGRERREEEMEESDVKRAWSERRRSHVRRT